MILSMEAFARIAVSGFILDPAVSFSSVFKARFSSQPQADLPPSFSTPSVVSLDSSIRRQHSLNKASRSRSLSLRERLVNFFVNFRELFRLHREETQRPSHPLHPSSSSGSFPTLYETRPSLTGTDSYQLQNASQISAKHQHSSLLSRNDSTIALPYEFSISRSTDKTTRNVPYLRHSWCRIDFIAIVSFWISFGLAMGGIERGAKHVGVFRALSVLRTARLLSITSGTTVSAR
jgi:voltage-dependent calcium channel